MHRSVSETRRSVATRPKVSTSTRPAYVGATPQTRCGRMPQGADGSRGVLEVRVTVDMYRFLLSRRWLGLLAAVLLFGGGVRACSPTGSCTGSRPGTPATT